MADLSLAVQLGTESAAQFLIDAQAAYDAERTAVATANVTWALAVAGDRKTEINAVSAAKVSWSGTEEGAATALVATLVSDGEAQTEATYETTSAQNEAAALAAAAGAANLPPSQQNMANYDAAVAAADAAQAAADGAALVAAEQAITAADVTEGVGVESALVTLV